MTLSECCSLLRGEFGWVPPSGASPQPVYGGGVFWLSEIADGSPRGDFFYRSARKSGAGYQ